MDKWNAANPQPVAPTVAAPQAATAQQYGVEQLSGPILPGVAGSIAREYVGPVNGAEGQTPDYARMDGQRAQYYQQLAANAKGAGMAPSDYVATQRQGPMGQAALNGATERVADQKKLQQAQANTWAADGAALASQQALQRRMVTNPLPGEQAVGDVPMGTVRAESAQQEQQRQQRIAAAKAAADQSPASVETRSSAPTVVQPGYNRLPDGRTIDNPGPIMPSGFDGPAPSQFNNTPNQLPNITPTDADPTTAALKSAAVRNRGKPIPPEMVQEYLRLAKGNQIIAKQLMREHGWQ